MKIKNFIIGFISIVIILLFTYSSISIFNIENTVPIIKELKQESNNLNHKIDSVNKINTVLKEDVFLLKEDLKNSYEVLNDVKQLNLESYNNFKKLKNEKDYIPNVSYNEQLDFITKYKFSPVE